MSTPPDAESAVRRYLEYLVDPSSLVDHAAIESIESELAATSDPIDKLRLYTRLERARAADGEAVKLGFIMAAKAWADDQGVSLGAFQQLGVPDDVLLAAGFVVPGRSRPRASRAAGAGRTRRPGVSSEVIKVHVLGREGRFTLAQVIDEVGGSPLTVRKAVDDLVHDGKIRRLGPDTHHTGRGRAPIVYESV